MTAEFFNSIGQIGSFAIREASDELAPQVAIHPIEVGPAGSTQSGSLFKDLKSAVA
jgi:hypothetical protein